MQVETETMVLFWGKESIFSNWYGPMPFSMVGADGLFDNSEAAFMYAKAMTFSDKETADQILTDPKHDPKFMKALGRKVKNFDQGLWDDVKESKMYTACLAKFQIPEAKAALLATGNKWLVEASPYDLIWGIGLAPNDPLALDLKNWKGLNLLGKTLMKVRALLQIVETAKTNSRIHLDKGMIYHEGK